MGDADRYDARRRRRLRSSWRQVVRVLAYHRGQTIAVTAMVALIAGGASFAPWYTHLVDDSATRQAFAVGEPGSTLRLTGPGAAALPEALPADGDRLLTDPVRGSESAREWEAGNRANPVQGSLLWRDDVCRHVVFLEGRCPAAPAPGSESVEVAVSEADVELYELSVGDVVPEVAITYPAVDFEVVGIYRVEDGDDPYWYDVLPTGRSGSAPDLTLTPLADAFIVDRDAVAPPVVDLAEGGAVSGSYQETLDLRVDDAMVTSDEVAGLRSLLARVRGAADGAGITVSTDLETTFAHLERAGRVASTTMVLTAAQVAVSAVAVLAMLVGVALHQRRPELGLSRLRGRSFGSLIRWLSMQWLVVVVAGGVAGALVGLVASASARAFWLPTTPALTPPIRVAGFLAGTMVVSLLLLVSMARPVVREPVPALLRATGPRSAAVGGSRVLIDGVLVTAAVCGLLVGLYSADESALSLLAPSLLAVAASVLVVRVLIAAAVRLSRRWLVRGRTTAALTAVLIARGQGTRLVFTVVSLSAAFVVFTTQIALVAQDNRDDRAQVEAGAAAVSRTDAAPARVAAALDTVDPDRDRATLVVSRGPRRAGDLGTLFVEPDAFSRIAPGAGAAASPREWSMIANPVEPGPALVGRSLRATVAPHALGEVDGAGGAAGPTGEVEIRVDYVQATGLLATARLGTVSLTDRTARVLETSISCARPCRVLRWSLDPDTDASGAVALDDIETLDADGPRPVELGGSRDWLRADGSAEDATYTTGTGTLEVRGSSGGLPFTIQHRSAPPVLPVLLARDAPGNAGSASATISTPAGSVVPIDVVGTADEAIPRVLRDVAVADVTSIVRRGEYNVTDGSEVQLWYAATADRAALDEELAALGVDLRLVDTVDDYEAAYDDSSEALIGRVNLWAAGLALLLGLLALVVSVAGSWRSRTRDLASLRIVGLATGSLTRATSGYFLVIVTVGLLVGIGCGLVGFVLAIRRTPLFATPEPEIPLDLGLQPLGVAVVVAIVLAALGLVSMLCGRWLVRRSSLNRIRTAGE